MDNRERACGKVRGWHQLRENHHSCCACMGQPDLALRGVWATSPINVTTIAQHAPIILEDRVRMPRAD